MGATQSTSTNVTSVLTSVVTDVLNQNTSSCSVDITQKNSNTILASNGGTNVIGSVEQKNDAKLTMSCVQQLTSNTKILNDIQNAVKQAAESSTSGLSLSAYSSTTGTNSTSISQQVTNAIKNINWQSCQASYIQENNLDVIATGTGSSNTINSILQSNSAAIALDCIQNAISSTEAVSKLQNAVDNKATATSSGLDMSTLLYGGLAIGLIIVVILIILLIV